jgi:DNA repair protein RadD
MKLREYQQEAIDSIFAYYQNGGKGNVLITIPTGGGKSLCIAKLCEEVCTRWSNQKILLLAHRKELLEQNAAKLFKLYPDADMGIYSAGLNSRQLGRKITVAGIQSIYNKGALLGYQSLVVIDEAHLCPPEGEGMYQTLIQELLKYNPNLKLIGFTATAFRLKSGLLTDDGGIFTDIVYDISITKLIELGYLSPLVSKAPQTQANLDGVKVRGGEFVAADAERAMDKEALTNAAINEMEKYGQDRKSWLIFAAGVTHAKHVADALNERGHSAEVVIGDTPSLFRDQHLKAFREGKLKCIVNCDVLTTGFDAPNIDMLVLLRPTQSTGLYIQMVGRGSRISPGKKDCLVLDFAGNIERHGPVDAIRIKKGRAGAPGEVSAAPTKICPDCREPIAAALYDCPRCGHQFPMKATHDHQASSAPILSTQIPVEDLKVLTTNFVRHEKTGKPPSMRVKYEIDNSGQGNLYSKQVSEWVCFQHEGYARQKAVKWWVEHHREFSFENAPTLAKEAPKSVDEALSRTRELRGVKAISTRKDGDYDRIISYVYKDPAEEPPLPAKEEYIPFDDEDEFREVFGINI